MYFNAYDLDADYEMRHTVDRMLGVERRLLVAKLEDIDHRVNNNMPVNKYELDLLSFIYEYGR